MSYQIELLRKHTSFRGEQCYYRDMAEPMERYIELAIYLPEAVLADEHCSVIYYLPDLMSTAHKTASQSDYQRYANRYDMIVVVPDLFGAYEGDLKERVLRYAKERDAINTYITEYLPKVVEHHFRAYETRSLMGFGFGGSIAFNLAFQYPEKFRGVSVFSPWVGFVGSPWFENLCADTKPSANIDPLVMFNDTIEANPEAELIPTWIDIGSEDQLIGKQIHMEAFEHALSAHSDSDKITFIERKRYDHTFYYVASHIREHFVFHAEYHEDEEE